jgi:hypothetical protein
MVARDAPVTSNFVESLDSFPLILGALERSGFFTTATPADASVAVDASFVPGVPGAVDDVVAGVDVPFAPDVPAGVDAPFAGGAPYAPSGEVISPSTDRPRQVKILLWNNLQKRTTSSSDNSIIDFS